MLLFLCSSFLWVDPGFHLVIIFLLLKDLLCPFLQCESSGGEFFQLLHAWKCFYFTFGCESYFCWIWNSRVAFFHLSTFKMLFQCHLHVVFIEKWAVILTFVLLYVVCLYFLTAFKIFSLSIVLSSSPSTPVLLRYNWHTGLYKFKVCSMIKIFFPMLRTFRIPSLSSVQTYDTSGLTVVIMYITSLTFIYLKFMPFDHTWIQFPHAPLILNNFIVIYLDIIFSSLGFSEFLSYVGLQFIHIIEYYAAHKMSELCLDGLTWINFKNKTDYGGKAISLWKLGPVWYYLCKILRQ